MRKTTGVLLALCALAAAAGRADDPEPDAAKAELKKLKGTWTLTKQAMDGKEWKARFSLTFTFDGDKLVSTQIGSLRGKGKFESTDSFKVKIDTKKKPHAIDLVGDRKRSGSTEWIYKIEKGELYLARRLPGRGKGAKAPERPKGFKGEGVLVFVMTREKEKEKAKEKPKE
jgi:uncharacterized protein (TIGR03067 family)